MRANPIYRVQLTVSNFEACVRFYTALMEHMKLNIVIKDENLLYWVSGRIGLAIARCGDAYRDDRAVQERVGLHHLCFRAHSRKEVNQIHELAAGLDATIIAPPRDWPWSPVYYATTFKDPAGIHLEVAFIRGKGEHDETMTVPIPRTGHREG